MEEMKWLANQLRHHYERIIETMGEDETERIRKIEESWHKMFSWLWGDNCRLAEENRRLKAVAEAAQKVNNMLNTWPNMTKYHPAACDLNKALAELEEEERSYASNS